MSSRCPVPVALALFAFAAVCCVAAAEDQPPKAAKASRPGGTKASAATKISESGGSAPSVSASAAKSHSLGAVRPSNLVLPQVAISYFDGGPEAQSIGKVIENDLVLADVAAKPSNRTAAAAAANRDRQTNSVNVDAWVPVGVNYVLRGALQGSRAEAELFDVASRQRVFGQSYSGFSANEYRRLGHRVANDIMNALTGQPGIFSTKICYLSQRGGGSKEIVVCDPDGGDARQLTNEQALVATPCWGLNGTEVYYTSYRDSNPDLYGITLAGSRFEISRRPGLNTSPSWNGSTGRLAVSLSKDGNSEIYTMSRDGRDLARLTSSPDADTAPEWSPDGGQIALTSDRSGTPQIYVMSASGGDAQRISSGGYCDSPAWSPDGSKIAYVVREGGEFNIYVAHVAGGGSTAQLTRGQRDNHDPAWAPDSRHLVFSSNRAGSAQLFVMNTDTRRAHQITNSRTACTQPAWGPAGRQ